MTASHLSCAIALQAALEREQDETRRLRAVVAERDEHIRQLEQQLAAATNGDLAHD